MTVSATRVEGRRRGREDNAVSGSQLRAALEQALRSAAADQRIGPAIGASGLRLRLEFTDVDLILDLTSDQHGRNLGWSFAERPGTHPKLTLAMPAAIANRYLLGRESIAIAIARGQVMVRGDSRLALLYLPAAQLLCGPYRTAVEADFPDLAQAAGN
jgi:hypothetical protein